MTRLAFFVVLAFAVVVLATPMGRAPIWEPNEAAWVLLARDMVERGHWLVPEIRGVPDEGLYKPQLYSWSIALVSLPIGRVTELTAAIPSIVSAIATVVGVVTIGSLLWSARAGMVAGLILATTPNYFVFAHRSLADVMMTAFMVWALYFLLRARRDGSLRPRLFFYSCIGGAMLCKGPPGLAALVAAAVASWLEGGRPALRRLRPTLGVLVLAVLAVPWIIPYVVAARPVFVRDVVVGEYAHWFFKPVPLSLSGEGPVYMPDTVWERVLIACLTLVGAVGVVFATRRDRLLGVAGVVAIVPGAMFTLEGLTSPVRRARYYDVPALAAAATAHTTPGGTVFGYPDLSPEYDLYVRRRIVEIGSEEVARLLAEPPKDVVIMTGRRWAARAGTVAPAWQVLESRTVGGRDIVVVGGTQRTHPASRTGRAESNLRRA